jgi:hypothetical protein
MAEAITKKQIKQLPIVPYEKIRETLQTGDIFQFRQLYFFRHYSKAY